MINENKREEEEIQIDYFRTASEPIADEFIDDRNANCSEMQRTETVTELRWEQQKRS